MQLNRKPSAQEEKLLELLVGKSAITIPENWKEGLLVRSMDDDGMGSLHLFPQGQVSDERVFGKRVSEFQFKDLDGVEVIVSLHIDNNGSLFEQDVWKTDFGKLLSFPG